MPAIPQPLVFQLRAEPVRDLREHAAIPSAFEARSVIDAAGRGDGFQLTERALDAPYRKNYDSHEDPLSWPNDFDTSRWILIAAFVQAERIGGVIVAAHSAGVDLLEGRTDLAVLWDLRVTPAHRRRAVATSLVRAAQDWASAAGCTELKVETQNTNPAACRFYQRNGFALAQVHRDAYPALPGDVQMIWRKRIGG